MKMQLTYKTQISYEFPDRDIDPDIIEDKLFNITNKFKDLDMELFIGNACCSPYITLESHNIKELQKAFDACISYLSRWKGIEIC